MVDLATLCFHFWFLYYSLQLDWGLVCRLSRRRRANSLAVVGGFFLSFPPDPVGLWACSAFLRNSSFYVIPTHPLYVPSRIDGGRASLHCGVGASAPPSSIGIPATHIELTDWERPPFCLASPGCLLSGDSEIDSRKKEREKKLYDKGRAGSCKLVSCSCLFSSIIQHIKSYPLSQCLTVTVPDGLWYLPSRFLSGWDLIKSTFDVYVEV